MTPDANDDDRTVYRPPGSTPETGFQRTEWSGSQDAGFQKTEVAGAGAELERTQITPPPGRAAAPAAAPAGADMGGHLPVGTRLREFEITSLIGEGGFGVVYLAFDHQLQRRVALKEYMPSSLAQRVGNSGLVQVKSERHRETFQAGLKSFVNEARLLASFDHPSLVKVYQFWEDNGTAYMVMPLLEGTTLKDVLRSLGERPDEAWLRSVLGPLTEALLVIHAEQCYHRDIAPDNVMLLPASHRWLLLDFGAARRVIGDMTQALTVILKPGYAPVEQYAEIPGMKQGPWTDVYALAAVVYYAIMGRTPPPSVGRLLNDTYVPLSQAAAGRYSEAFLAAVDKALAVRPEQRTQTIGDFRRDLGLGAVAADPYVTTPLPPNTQIPPRPPAGATVAQPATAMRTESAVPQTAMAPEAPRPAAPAPAPAPVATAEPAAAPARKGNSALVGIGLGVVVLGALGFGGYALLNPAPKPGAGPQANAPAPVPTPAAPPPTQTPTQTPTPAAAPAVATAPVTAPAPAPAPAVPGPLDPAREFARVVQAQTPGFDVKLETNKTSYRINKDNLVFSVHAQRDGYVYLFAVGADGVLTQLMPNDKQPAPKVKAGQALKLPGASVVIPASPPAGPTDLLLVVAASQRDYGALKPKKDGIFSVFPGGTEGGALAAAVTGPVPPMAGKASCAAGAACDEAFGAAAVRVDVVN